MSLVKVDRLRILGNARDMKKSIEETRAEMKQELEKKRKNRNCVTRFLFSGSRTEMWEDLFVDAYCGGQLSRLTNLIKTCEVCVEDTIQLDPDDARILGWGE
jgi:hypothetical protein